MSVLFLLVPIALVLVGIALAAYVWAVRRGQFDDLTTPAIRALHEDEPRSGPGTKPTAPKDEVP